MSCCTTWSRARSWPDVVKLKTAKTVQGEEVKIDAARWHLHRHVKVNDANIIQADIIASNGSATPSTKY